MAVPFKKPYFTIACRVYSEQVGRNRQLGGKYFLLMTW